MTVDASPAAYTTSNGTRTSRARSASRPSSGLCWSFGCFGAFGVWGAVAPLAAAVIAQGSFVATGQNKIVQHLEGGIIKEMLVNEGDYRQGQPAAGAARRDGGTGQ